MSIDPEKYSISRIDELAFWPVQVGGDNSTNFFLVHCPPIAGETLNQAMMRAGKEAQIQSRGKFPGKTMKVWHYFPMDFIQQIVYPQLAQLQKMKKGPTILRP